MMVSLIIPLYNEEKIIDKLYQEVKGALLKISEDFEVILVNDGSQDNTLSRLMMIHSKDARFKVLDLSRNFGHQAAYTAGLAYAKGEYIAMMDGDLQDPPELLQSMHVKLASEGFDIIYGLRTDRKETFWKKILFKLFHSIFSKVSNIKIPANAGNFSMMNRKALDAFLSLQEKNRYLPGLRFFIGFKQGYVNYVRPDRSGDDAKMTTGKLLKLALDAFFSFSKLPIRICLLVGFLGILFTLGGAGIVLYKKMIGVAITGWTSILLSIYFIGSVQLLFLGIIGEYIHRIFVESQNRPIFVVKDFYN